MRVVPKILVGIVALAGPVVLPHVDSYVPVGQVLWAMTFGGEAGDMGWHFFLLYFVILYVAYYVAIYACYRLALRFRRKAT